MTHPIQSYLVTVSVYTFLVTFVYAITRNALTYNTWSMFQTLPSNQSLGGSMCYLATVLPSLLMMLIYPIISLVIKKTLLWVLLNIFVSLMMFTSSISSITYLYAYNADVSTILRLSLTIYFVLEIVLSITLLIYTHKTVRAHSNKSPSIHMNNIENPSSTTPFIPSNDFEATIYQFRLICKQLLYFTGAMIYAPLCYHVFYMYTTLAKYQSTSSDNFFAIGFQLIPISFALLYACAKGLRGPMRCVLLLVNVTNWIICSGIASSAH